MSSFIVRNEDGALGRVIFSFRLPSPFPGKYAVRFKRFTRGKKGQECEPSFLAYRHFERSREIFLADRSTLCAKKLRNATSGHRFRETTCGMHTAVQERSLDCARDDDTGNALFSLLPEEGGSVHASPFPWKGLPSAARRGWLSFWRRSRLLFAFPIGEGGPRQRWIGYSRKRRT